MVSGRMLGDKMRRLTEAGMLAIKRRKVPIIEKRNPCSMCLGTKNIPFDADDIYDADFLVRCYYCNGTGIEDGPEA